MKKFVICIEETICQQFEVVAETAEEAMKSAEKLYKIGSKKVLYYLILYTKNSSVN